MGLWEERAGVGVREAEGELWLFRGHGLRGRGLLWTRVGHWGLWLLRADAVRGRWVVVRRRGAWGIGPVCGGIYPLWAVLEAEVVVVVRV